MDRKKDIKQKFEPFKKKASKDILIKKMILFGSRAKGKTGKDIDADFIIVSPDFKNMDFFQRGAIMYNYWDLRLPVDFLCYSPEEFNQLRKRVSIVSEAIREGIEI
ncbi:MAG TPA: nucleotidyltransferase domain-containing protein [Candidatus Nanoarchaeia archaeon]|nr:nucleotidyltransferase domain-containing protein [Candidatus Nanoarchaeia archaeon]